ncbi:MAG: PQQ-binding-like beta-propeller repeat protein [Planctomycetota bacterium]|nr:PQQ-binding-like beta-propeller repeat protein [Planctomycetota bacterium]
MRRICGLFAGALLAVTGTVWGMTADELVQRTGIVGGLCSFPRLGPGEEKLAIELAQRPTFVVHALSPSALRVAATREAAEDAGVLGRSLYVEQGAAAPLPFADRLVDLLVISDLRDADLTSEARTAWLRVLAPQRGTALVGRAKTAGSGLSQDALKAWTKDLPLAKVFADDSGVWALVRNDLPAGSEPWTHRSHAGDNTQVSGDSTLKPPFLTQWWGMPRQEGFWGTTVIASHGRMFSLRSSRNPSSQVFLTARSLTSGIVLWQRLLHQAPEGQQVPHGGYVPGRSSMIVVDDVLFLIDRDGVLRLNAETGAELNRLAGPKPKGQVKWIACSGSLLATLSGDADVVVPISYQTIADNPTGRDLAIYDLPSNRLLWKDTLAGNVDERAILVRDDRLYYLADGVGVVCRELRTGKTVWTNPDAELQAEFRIPASKIIREFLVSQPTLLAPSEVLLLKAKWAKNTAVLSRADGRLLWKKPTAGGSYRALTALPINGQWVGGGPTLDLLTGSPSAGPRFISSGCGPTTAVPGYLITCFGAVSDMQSGKMVRHEDIKSPCDVGSLVAEGMLITVPSECGCNYEVKGYRVLTSAGNIQPHTAPDWQPRLTVLDTAEPAALAVTAADWPTYRRDPQRSATSTATVGDQPKVLWQWTPKGAAPYQEAAAAGAPRLTADFLATAPVAAAGNVYFASHDGTLRCVRAADGQEVWKFATGSMLFAPPTIWGGRVLAGGGDGRVYCLDATTGRCLWSLLAAPVDRRVFWFGHLVSTWPVVPGVVVQDNVAYAVAGYQKENGVHAYAIDPKSGNVLWEKDDAGSGGPAGPGSAYSSIGSSAVAAGRLWLCSSTSAPGSFELKSGDWKPAGGGQFGCELGVLDGKWVIQGGRRLSETQETLTRPLGESGFAASAVDKPSPRIPLSASGTSLPVWDAELCVLPPKGQSGSLTAAPTAKVTEWLANKAAQTGKPAAKAQADEWSEFKLWATEPITPISLALAKDQLVVAYESGRSYKLSGFRRTDGSKAWTVDLPEQPVMNRLAIDRDGRVLTALCDGSVLCLGQ